MRAFSNHPRAVLFSLGLAVPALLLVGAENAFAQAPSNASEAASEEPPASAENAPKDEQETKKDEQSGGSSEAKQEAQGASSKGERTPPPDADSDSASLEDQARGGEEREGVTQARGTAETTLAEETLAEEDAPLQQSSKVAENSVSEDESDAETSEKLDGEVEAKEQDEEPALDYSKLPWTYHQKHIDLMAGISFNRTADDALVPFLDAPFMAGGYVRAGGAFLSMGRLSLGTLVEFGGSQSESLARSLESSVRFLHITAGVEPRLHLHPRLYLYARVMLGAQHSKAELGGEFSDERLSDGAWAFRGDGNLGLAVRLVGAADGRKRSPRLWVFGEGGYRYSTAYELELEVDGDTGPSRPEPLDIEPYSNRGVRGSIGLMGSF